MNTSRNFDLLRRAVEIIDGIPAEHFNLDYVFSHGDGTDCGSVGCVMGWLAHHPEFQALGLGVSDTNSLHMNGKFVFFDKAAAEIFGFATLEMEHLFGMKGFSKYDDPSINRYERLADHRPVFKRRLIRFFQENGQPVNPAYCEGVPL